MLSLCVFLIAVPMKVIQLQMFGQPAIIRTSRVEQRRTMACIRKELSLEQSPGYGPMACIPHLFTCLWHPFNVLFLACSATVTAIAMHVINGQQN